MRWLSLFAVVVSAAVAAGAASAAGGAERVTVSCDAAYFPELGTWFAAVFTPDTPAFVPIGPEGPGPFAGGDGTAVFTPSGNMEVSCKGEANPLASPPFSGPGQCVALRGGDEFGHGSRSYNGEGRLVVTPSGNVSITCHGSFTGVVP
jgi:hypothetical protein